MDHTDAIRIIRECAEIAQRQIRELHERDPENETFTQVGLLDGEESINNFLSHNEWGIALEHLLYMIHESDIAFDRARVAQLHRIAEQFKVRNHYTRNNLSRLGTLSKAFNVPPA